LNRHVMATCMAGGTLEYKDTELALNRRGSLEPAWLDLFYSPVIDESGKPGGVIAVVVETTERVLARRAAVKQSERLAQMFQDAPSFMAQMDGPDHVFTFTNAAYQQLIAHRDVMGRPIRDALPEIAAQGFYELLDQVYRTGEGYRGSAVPVTLQRTKGAAPEQRLLDFVYQPVRDTSGNVTGIFVEGIDVTDSARDSMLVRENEARLAFLDRLGRAMVESRDADAILATTTRMVGEYLGVSVCAYVDMDADEDGLTIRGEWCGPGATSLLGRQRLRDFGERTVRELRAGRPLIVDDTGALPAKEAAAYKAIDVAAVICMPLIREGRLTALMSVNHNAPRHWTDNELALIREVADRSWAHIERARAEAAMRDAAERLSMATTAAEIGTFDFNPVTGELKWDARCRALFALPADAKVSYEVFLAGTHIDDRARMDEAVRKVLDPDGTGVLDQEYRAVGFTDGVERWISAAGRTFFHDRTPRRFVGTVIDISERKRAEAALADLNATLERRVAERTHQLLQTEEALRQAQKMEAVGQLTGGIAHDFNNLLQGITGALDRVQHRITEGRPGEADRFLKAATDAASRAAALTHRLLAFSRRQTLDPRPLDANRLIGGMEELIRRTMGPNVAIEVVGAMGLWPIRVDPSQLENSLLNLCINARDAMPEGGKLIIETANKWLDDHASRDRDIPPGQYVSLCVTDTGAGMTPEVVERAFDPFFTTKPIGRGTGLGLSMVYGFVRQSGGQVRIYSELGKGTTMCLYFPRHLGPVEEQAAPHDQAVEHGFGETVLLVDDDATVRMLLAEVLTESGYKILEAGDGPAAMKILSGDQRIDLMVTDVGLPGGMNGRQVADAARTMRKDLKVLFITGYAENAAITSGHLEAGMQILAKPFAMSTLANKVREMLER
ncbi:MAG TPA: response regulator, partial [Rhizomicrobium sp.]|nr:response regulator [Rhizomicrobium sp.]